MRACTSVSGGSTPVDTCSVSGWSPGTESRSMLILWLARAGWVSPPGGRDPPDRWYRARRSAAQPRRQHGPLPAWSSSTGHFRALVGFAPFGVGCLVGVGGGDDELDDGVQGYRGGVDHQVVQGRVGRVAPV